MEPTVRGGARGTFLTTGQRLSKLMANQGVTARSLAGTLRIQESTLANFRKGFRRIPSDVMASMARELDTNVDYLLERSEDARPHAVILEEAHSQVPVRGKDVPGPR
jgi:transcriptional regulator with XRE-family HTH domain